MIHAELTVQIRCLRYLKNIVNSYRVVVILVIFSLPPSQGLPGKMKQRWWQRGIHWCVHSPTQAPIWHHQHHHTHDTQPATHSWSGHNDATIYIKLKHTLTIAARYWSKRREEIGCIQEVTQSQHHEGGVLVDEDNMPHVPPIHGCTGHKHNNWMISKSSQWR